MWRLVTRNAQRRVAWQRGFASSVKPPPVASTTAAASTRRPTFRPPAGSPADFLAELRSFAAKHPNTPADELPMPLSFSGDAALLLSGKRRVVSAASEFSFGCTGCGACCRSYPNDVMLDSHDIFLLSRSGGVAGATRGSAGTGLRSTTALYERYPRAFNRQMGVFESGENLVEENSDSGAPMASMHKLAPVLFLRTKRVKQVSKATGAARVEERCWFSVGHEKMPIVLADESNAAASSAPAEPTVVRPPSRSAASTSVAQGAGLRCSLGPANMPTACALYPLGELYSSTSHAAPGEAAEAPAAEYWTLDEANCEGTRAVTLPSGASARTTVSAYAERNGLPQRRAEWEWYERAVVQPLASHGWMSLEPSGAHAHAFTPSVITRLANTVADVLYDFDSLQLTPTDDSAEGTERRFPDWPSARAAITAAVQDVIAATQAYVSECGAPGGSSPRVQRVAEERWIERMRSKGLFKGEEE